MSVKTLILKQKRMRQAYLKKKPAGMFDGKGFRSLHSKPKINADLEIVPGKPVVQLWQSLLYQNINEFKYYKIIDWPYYQVLVFFSGQTYFIKEAERIGPDSKEVIVRVSGLFKNKDLMIACWRSGSKFRWKEVHTITVP